MWKVAKRCKNDPLENFNSIGLGLEVPHWHFILVKESYGNKLGMGHLLCYGRVECPVSIHYASRHPLDTWKHPVKDLEV